jgi:hypothetical protein
LDHLLFICFYFWSKIKLWSYTDGESKMFMVLVISLSLPKCVKWVVSVMLNISIEFSQQSCHVTHYENYCLLGCDVV